MTTRSKTKAIHREQRQRKQRRKDFERSGGKQFISKHLSGGKPYKSKTTLSNILQMFSRTSQKV